MSRLAPYFDAFTGYPMLPGIVQPGDAAPTPPTNGKPRPPLGEQPGVQNAAVGSAAVWLAGRGLGGAYMGWNGTGAWVQPPRGSYHTYRMMSLNPTLTLVRSKIVAPILSSQWTVAAVEGRDAPQAWVDEVAAQLLPQRQQILAHALRYLEFGWWPFHLGWRAEDARLRATVTPLVPEQTQVFVNQAGGDLAGIKNGGGVYTDGDRQQQADASTLITTERCWVVTCDREASNYYGRSWHEAAYDPWCSWNRGRIDAALLRGKIAGIIPILKYPPGSTPIGGVDTDNGTVAKRILESIGMGHGVAMPSIEAPYDDIVREPALAKTSLWTLDFYDAGTYAPAQTGMLESNRYDDALMARAWKVGERAVIEATQAGSRADSQTHADAAMAVAELVDDDVADQLNAGVVDTILAVNFGERARGSVRVEAAPLVDTKTTVYAQVLTAGLADKAVGPALSQIMEWGEVLKGLDIPTRKGADVAGLIAAGVQQQQDAAQAAADAAKRPPAAAAADDGTAALSRMLDVVEGCGHGGGGGDPAAALAYDPEQPRDDDGRWSPGATVTERATGDAYTVRRTTPGHGGRTLVYLNDRAGNDTGKIRGTDELQPAAGGAIPSDPAAFADRVRAAAARAAAAGDGATAVGDKVRIDRVHAHYEAAHGPVPLSEFKRRLTQVNGEHGLDLAREDLVPDARRAALAAAEARHGASAYHYVRVSRPVALDRGVDDAAAGHWVTIDHQHVLLGRDGTILGGRGKGKHVDDVFGAGTHARTRFTGARVGADVHAHAESVKNEIARKVGGKPEEETDAAGQRDKKPFDVRVRRQDAPQGHHDIEVKSMTVGAKQALSVHEDALLRKVEHAAANPQNVFHTVAVDERATYGGGANAGNFSGNRLYYKRGSGRYALSQMHPVASGAELRRLLNAPDHELPEAARGALPSDPAELRKLREQAAKTAESRKARDTARKARNRDVLREQARARSAKKREMVTA